MNLSIKKTAAFIGCMMLALLLSAGLFGNKVSAAENTAESGGITVSITTDKDRYAEGEEIHYEISVTNNKAHYKSDKMTFTYGNTEGLKAAPGTDLPKEVPVVDSGETVVISGTMIGDVSKFTDDSLVPTLSPSESAGNGSDGEAGETEKSSNVMLILGIVVLFLIGGTAGFFMTRRKGGNSLKVLLAIVLSGAVLSGSFCGTSASTVSAAANPEKVTVRPYVKFIYADHEVMIRAVLEFSLYQTYQSISSEYLANAKRVTCHDPSIFKDFDGRYYIFGTHMSASYTDDLYDWKSFDDKFKASFSQSVRDEIKAWNKDSGNWFGYLWAPDIVYNPIMEKYCLYISANGDDWKSNIVMCTSDNINGPWEYAGSVVYGGFDETNFTETDLDEVLDCSELPERYIKQGIKNRKWGDAWPNCIDPCVFYDKDGNLWMSYGSWSGGIFMLALDETTGLRDYSVSYAENIHSDPYFGKKIAGGSYVSGEASYIQRIGDYYYLFISYGNLEAAGGYNVRVFRSEQPDDRYVDALGNTPYYDSYVFNYNNPEGVRLFGGYKWRTFVNGQVAQGHNSAFVDDDGKAYIVFHTRTDNGTEGHVVKAHQLFTNKEGWIVAAPYQTSGETLPDGGLSVDQIVGEYDIIIHDLNINYKNLETKKSVCAFLNADGTITGELSGNWTVDAGTPYINVCIGDVNYSGVALRQNIENSTLETTVFTGLGDTNQITIWGSRVAE